MIILNVLIMVDSLAYGSASKVVADDILKQKTKNKNKLYNKFFFLQFFTINSTKIVKIMKICSHVVQILIYIVLIGFRLLSGSNIGR